MCRILVDVIVKKLAGIVNRLSPVSLIAFDHLNCLSSGEFSWFRSFTWSSLFTEAPINAAFC